MFKTHSILTLCFLVLLAVPLSALDVDVSGDWELTMQTRRGGERTMDIHIDQEGEKITVTWTGFRGEEVKAEGTIKGNEIEWSFTREGRGGGEFTMTYKGKVEGDTMTGEAQMGDFGSMEWTAKKK